MRERTAFTLFWSAMALLEVAWIAGLKQLGASDELIGHTVVLLLPVAALGGGWIFTRYH